ncbi:Plac8 family protein, partial [Globisporangium splendens]
MASPSDAVAYKKMNVTSSTAPPAPSANATYEPAHASEAQYTLLGEENDGLSASTPYLPPAFGTWESSFFGCLGTPGHCCVATCLPYVSAAYIAHSIGESWIFVGLFFFVTSISEDIFLFWLSSKRDATWYSPDVPYSTYLTNNFLYDSETVTGVSVVSAISTVLYAVGVMTLRISVREHYRIPGSFVEDCWSSFLCGCCSLTQMSSHVEKSKLKRNTLPAYQSA